MKKQILILSRPLSNILDEGSKNLVYYLCKYSEDNLSVLVEKKFSLYLPPNITQIKINKTIDKRFVENSRSLYVKFRLVKEILQFWNYETIHTFFALTPLSAVVLIFSKKILNKKIIVNIPYLSKKAYKSKLVNTLLKISDQIIVMSDFTKNRLKYFEQKITKIPPLIDVSKYYTTSENEKSIIKDKLKIKTNFIILVPGEYNRLGMTGDIVKIIKNINSLCLNEDILFILAFRIKTSKDLKKEIKTKYELKEFNNILFLNTVDNYHEYCAISDLAMFPATKNQKFDLPLSLVEFMAMGKPVFHYNISPFNELYNQNSSFCFPINAEIMAKKTLEIINNKKEYKKLCQDTIKKSKNFLPGNILSEYHQIYEAVKNENFI